MAARTKHYKLQLLIPRYNESEEVMRSMFDSLAIQQNIDFKKDVGVVICNDGTTNLLSQEFLNSYPFKVYYYKCKHRGVSATRNSCMDHANADYVMFCDADDMFYNNCGLWAVIQEIDKKPFDALNSTFVQEYLNPETHCIQYVMRQNDSTFVHGKVYNLQYLRDNDIRWNEDLTIHEDSYFNYQALMCASERRNFTTPFYLWKHRDDSVCRKDPLYMQKTYVNLLDSNEALIDKFMERGKSHEAHVVAVTAIYECYYNMNKQEWLCAENREYREKTLKRFKKFYDANRISLIRVAKDTKLSIVSKVRDRMFKEGLFMEKKTFEQFIKEVNKYGE